MATRITYSKLTTEEVVVQSSMIDRLAVGETISSVAAAIYVWSGVDAAYVAVLDGAPSHAGGIISQTVTGGVAGVIYKLLLSATTSAGNLLTNELKLAVLDTIPEVA